eukprot:TRINITY_DN1948_c0_g2_i13.p1 TRINITY_DN1948_c0_g2~~TRINITY_DN1948_c0_g2_i13.p1  ORF type:complete len:167 (-),score=33.42 TRINITY_DN1948_c0_g2_i13:385-885(-)
MMIQRVALTLIRPLSTLRCCAPVLPQHIPVAIRWFAKKQKKGLEIRKEHKEKMKQEAANEFGTIDAEDIMNEAKRVFEEIVASFKANLRGLKLIKTSPKSLGELTVYVEGVKEQLKNIADITIKTADTFVIIPRDGMYLTLIMEVNVWLSLGAEGPGAADGLYLRE